MCEKIDKEAITLKNLNESTIAEGAMRSTDGTTGPISIGMESKFYRPANATNGPRTFKGKVKEILVFNKNLTPSELTKIHYYLSRKWNLGAQLDSDGDSFTDAQEVAYGSSPIDPASSIKTDLSTVVDNVIKSASGLDNVEANLKVWLDGKNINAKSNQGLVDGSRIHRWVDLSGSGSNAVQMKSNFQAIYDNTTNSIVFNGSNNVYDIGKNITSNKSYTVIYVSHITDFTKGHVVFSQHGAANQNEWLHMGQFSETLMGLRHYNNDLDITIKNTNHPDISVFRFDNGKTPSHFINYNGKLVASGRSGGAVTHTGNNIIGKFNTSYFNGNISELLVFDTKLSDESITKINYYLSEKWGLKSSMDSDGDGYKDAEELAFGSSPIDASSKIVIDFSTSVHNQISNGTNDLNGLESNLTLWLDAKNINARSNTGISTDSKLSKWTDISGSGHAIFQEDTNAQPTIKTDHILFDGNNDYLTGENILNVGIHTGWTIMLVGQANNVTDTQSFLAKSHDSSQDNRYAILAHTNGYRSIFDDGAGKDTWNTQRPYQKKSIVVMNVNRSEKELINFVNGIKINDETTINQTSGYEMNTNSHFLIGAYNKTATELKENNFLNGRIYEILIFNKSLTSNEQAKVQQYLGKKWSLSSEVDSDSDGALDSIETMAGTSLLDQNVTPLPDFSKTVDSFTKSLTNLDSAETKLVLWLDATNVNMLNNQTLTNAAPISKWHDLSGNHYHLTGTNAPVLNTNHFDNKPAMNFEGNKYLISPTFNSTDEVTVFSVFQLSNTWKNSGYLFGHGNPNTNWAFERVGNSSKIHLQTANDSTNVAFESQYTSPYLMVGRIKNQNNRLLHLYSEPSGIQKVSNYIGGSKTNEFLPFKVGFSSNSNEFGNAKVNEIIYFKGALTDEEIKKISYYLSKKWGFEAFVDSDGDNTVDEADMHPLNATKQTATPLPITQPGTINPFEIKKEFYFTGQQQTFVVPDGVREITVNAIGAAGGKSGFFNGASNGGNGGRVEATIRVTPGETLVINIGGKGADGHPLRNDNDGQIATGGFNGGGNGGGAWYGTGGGAGGGATDIRKGGTSLENRIVVAGAGGGGGGIGGANYNGASTFTSFNSIGHGGAGGGTEGETGKSNASGDQNGQGAKGGAQTPGNGNNLPNINGSQFGQGEHAAVKPGNTILTEYNKGGAAGGGGGYIGGRYSHGTRATGGAGGGSSYVKTDIAQSVIHTQGYEKATGHGYLSIKYIDPNQHAQESLPYNLLSKRFYYTGDVQTFVIPKGINSISVYGYGASGGHGFSDQNGLGGKGGLLKADIPVTGGMVLNIYVGGEGSNTKMDANLYAQSNNNWNKGTSQGGYNGGANGGDGAGAGGGATDIRLDGTQLSDRIFVAGAGGGGGQHRRFSQFGGNGGHGGGLVGLSGQTGNNGTIGGKGGTGGSQTTGGTAETGINISTDSMQGVIAVGGAGANPNISAKHTAGGGGGGGYYGGAGGGTKLDDAAGGGGGGSSFIMDGSTNITHLQGFQSTNRNGFLSIIYELKVVDETEEDVLVSLSKGNFAKIFPDSTPLTQVKIIELSAKGDLRLGNSLVTKNQIIPADDLNRLTFKPYKNVNGKAIFKWLGNDLNVTFRTIITIKPVSDTHRFDETRFPTIAAEDSEFKFMPIVIHPDKDQYYIDIRENDYKITGTLKNNDMATINTFDMLSQGTTSTLPDLKNNSIYTIKHYGTTEIKLQKGTAILHTFNSNSPSYTWDIDQGQPTGNTTFKLSCTTCNPNQATINIAENNIIEFEMKNKPNWMNINKITGELTGNPTQANVGLYRMIYYSAKINGTKVESDPFTINVIGVNDKPISFSIPQPNQVTPIVKEGELLTVTLNATDEDNDPLQYLIAQEDLPKNGFASIQGNILTYLHNGSETTNDSLKYRVSDGKLMSDLSSVSINVTPVNDKPEILPRTFLIEKK